MSASEIEYWESRGFKIIGKFPGEYTLLYDYNVCQNVRVYENGKVLKTSRKTGEYYEVDTNERQP